MYGVATAVFDLVTLAEYYRFDYSIAMLYSLFAHRPLNKTRLVSVAILQCARETSGLISWNTHVQEADLLLAL